MRSITYPCVLPGVRIENRAHRVGRWPWSARTAATATHPDFDRHASDAYRDTRLDWLRADGVALD